MSKPHPIRSLSNLYDERIDPAFASLGRRLDRLYGTPAGSKPRREIVYGFAVLLALCMPLTYYVFDWTFLRERAFVYLLIFYFDAVGVKHILGTVDYAPGYKWEKALGGSAFLFLGIAVLFNLTTVNPSYQWAYAIMALVVQITALEFIWIRNKNLLRRLLRTRRGLVPMPPTLDECDHLADVVMALVRDDEVSPWVRSGLARSLGIPTKLDLAEILRLDLEDVRVRQELRARLAVSFGPEANDATDPAEAADDLAKEGRRAAPSC